MSEGGHYSLRNIRRGAAHFLLGKVGSAALTFVAFALTARLLGRTEYGIYVALVAGVEMALSLSTLGMDWTAGRYLPEFRTRGSMPQLRHFVVVVLGIQVLVMLFMMILIGTCAATCAQWLSVPDSDLVLCYAAILLVEGSSRVVRDQFLGLLLAQRAAQGVILVRGIVLVSLLCLLPIAFGSGRSTSLWLVAGAELLASMASLTVGITALVRLVRSHQPDVTTSGAVPWAPPTVRDMAVMARNAYASMLLLLPAGGPALTLVLASYGGRDAAAAFGFARGLVEQIRRFLPIELFLGLIRPVVVARYAAHHDFAKLSRQMSLVFAVSVLAALPVLALLVSRSVLVSRTIGGPGFEPAGAVLAVWAISLLLFMHRRTLEVVANTAEQSGVCVVAAVFLAASPLAMAGLLHLGFSVPAALAAPLSADVAFSCVVPWLLFRKGLRYCLPVGTLLRLLLVLLPLAIAGLVLSQFLDGPVWFQWLLALALSLGLTWGLAAIWRPFVPADRDTVNRVLPRPWFPF